MSVLDTARSPIGFLPNINTVTCGLNYCQCNSYGKPFMCRNSGRKFRAERVKHSQLLVTMGTQELSYDANLIAYPSCLFHKEQ